VSLLVFLSRDHSGRWGTRRGDLGATAPDGRREAMLTPLYLLAAEERLRQLGHEVIPLSDGSYDARHARANDLADLHGGRSVYVASHLNAGGGTYGLVCYDHRSGAANGPALARSIAARLKDRLGLATVKAEAASPSNVWANAHGTIGGLLDPIGICYEPLFIDGHAHLLTPTGLAEAGRALAEGIHAWATGGNA
jgi:hypothetical protein